jgi:hypothetical protein
MDQNRSAVARGSLPVSGGLAIVRTALTMMTSHDVDTVGSQAFGEDADELGFGGGLGSSSVDVVGSSRLLGCG